MAFDSSFRASYDIPENDGGLPRALAETDLPGLRLQGRGKVRDIYDLGERLLIVATDRISAFDFVMPTPIPDKGRVLTSLTLFWFDRLRNIVPNHVLSTDLREFHFKSGLRRILAGRCMIVRKTKPLPVECVVRGYLVGSGWKEYQQSGMVCGVPLRKGLRLAEKLEEPIFTPATKATTGHDENISFARAAEILGQDLAEKVRAVAIEIYRRAADYAAERGIIIADTKFEFGLCDGNLIWIDEALTPDSSRFWPADSYCAGEVPPSFDKQYLRDWLETKSGWKKAPPAPPLPSEVVAATRQKYLEALVRLTGQSLPPVEDAD